MFPNLKHMFKQTSGCFTLSYYNVTNTICRWRNFLFCDQKSAVLQSHKPSPISSYMLMPLAETFVLTNDTHLCKKQNKTTAHSRTFLCNTRFWGALGFEHAEIPKAIRATINVKETAVCV